MRPLIDDQPMDLWQTRPALAHFLVLAYYTLQTILMTYPAISHFTTHFPGTTGGDAELYIWNFWFFKESILQLHDPFFTDMWFYPIGLSLFFNSYTLVSTFLVFILTLFLRNLIVASNSVFLLSFILSGYFTFLLVDHLVRNKWAALLAGTIFAFCPFHLVRLLGHYEYIMVQWIPLFIFFFIKMAEPDGTYRQAIFAGIIAVLTMADVYYYAVFLMLFVALFYGYKFYHREQRRLYLGWTGVKKAVVLGTTSLVVGAPYFLLAYKHARAGYYDTAIGWQGANELSGDLLAFFVPSFLHPFWKPYVMKYFYERLGAPSGIETLTFVGWLVTILTVFSCLYLARRRPELRLWRFLFIAFTLLTLGPTLHIMGRYLFNVDGLEITIPLPFFVLHFVPIIRNMRTPSRICIMVMLCGAILSGYAWLWVQQKLQSQKRIVTAFVLINVIVLLEYVNVPFPIYSGQVSKVFHEIAKDQSPGTVLEVPLAIMDAIYQRGDRTDTGFWIYAQTVHKKDRIAGYTGRGVKKAIEYFDKFPVLRKLLDLQEGKEISFDNLDEDRKSLPDLLKATRIKYILVHPEFKNTPSHRYLAAVFNLREPDLQDNGLLVYKVAQAPVKPAQPPDAPEHESLQ